MRNDSVENLLPKAGYSIYRLVRLAAIRSLELADGKPSLIEQEPFNKLTTVALQEILQGKIGVEMPQSEQEDTAKNKVKEGEAK